MNFAFLQQPVLRIFLRWFLPLSGMVLMLFWSSQNTADVPKWDAFPLTGKPLVKSLEGTLTLADLQEQVVDNRMMFTRLVQVLLARGFHWSAPVEAMVSVLLGGFTVLLLSGIAHRTWPDGSWRPWLVAMAAGVSWFSLSGSMLWTYGPFFAHVLTVWLTIVLVWVLGLPIARHWKLMLGIPLAWVATNSFIYGWLCWGLLLWQIIGWGLDRLLTWRQVLGISCLLGVCIAMTAWSYFGGYMMAGEPGQGARVHADPMRYLNFFLQWLGSGLGNPWPTLAKPARLSWQYPLAWWAGLTVLVLLAWSVWGVVKNRSLWRSAWPWLGLAGWGCLGGIMVTLGRAELSSEAAFWPRYQLLVYGVYLAVFVLILLRWEYYPSRWRWLGLLPMGVALVGWINGSVTGYAAMRADFFSSQAVHGAVIMKEVAPDPVLLNQLLPGNYPMVQQVIGTLLPQGYIRPGVLTDETVAAAKIERSEAVQGQLTEGEILADGNINLTGWAVKSKQQCPADAIVISAQPEGGAEIWWTVTTNRKAANKMATKLKLSTANARIGWELGPNVTFKDLARKPLPAGKLTFRAYALDVSKLVFYPLPGEFVRP
jgi:hypothetical protein